MRLAGVKGTANTAVDIPVGGYQSFVLAVTPREPIAPTEVRLNFSCENASPAPILSGINTLLFSASFTPTADVIAMAATIGNTGIVTIPRVTGAEAFAVATVNVGTSAQITASADTGIEKLPLGIFLCQTSPGSDVCLAEPASGVTVQMNAGRTAMFAIIVAGTGTVIPLDPASNRIFVRFRDIDGVVRGATSVGVRTQ